MKDKYYLYVGNAYPHKNVELLQRAATRAQVRVIYVGKEDFFYKRMHIVPIGVIDSQLDDLYKNSEALVFPSFMEGFGLPVLEAISVGCPVIASDIPVFHELFGDVLTYFDPRDEDDLVRCLKNPPVRSKEFLQEVATVMKKYSWRKMAEETLKIYEGSDRLR